MIIFPFYYNLLKQAINLLLNLNTPEELSLFPLVFVISVGPLGTVTGNSLAREAVTASQGPHGADCR